MEQQGETLRGTVETVTFQNEDNGYAVLMLIDDEGELVHAVGPLAGSVPGEELTLAGRWVTHPSYGLQFEATGSIVRLPESESAILKYLSSGVLPGIGPVTARLIVDKFSTDALEILASDPERLAEVRGLTPQKAREAGVRFMELFGIREALATLGALGLSAGEALPIYRRYGEHTAQVIGRNPYLLCGPPLYLSFARVDGIADTLSIERDSEQRVRAALRYTLRHNQNNGHTCLPRAKLVDTAARFFAVEPEQVTIQLDEMLARDELQQAENKAGAWVYMPDMLRAERSAALVLRGMAGEKPPQPKGHAKALQKRLETLELMSGIQYAPLQKKAITEALERSLLVITGGPGTGKTTTVNAILSLFEQQADRVLLAAPTGRAAKRLSELTGRKASTIHRMLEVSYSPGAEQPSFNRNASNPLKCDVLVVDEMSMVDALLFESLLAALRPGARLVLVGDSDQLPSVGPGNVLKGILESGVAPVVALNQIFRQAASSLIVSNAHRIVEGQLPQTGAKEDDFFFLRAFGTACQKLVVDLACQRLPDSYGLSPVEDIQVLCPGRKGLLGTEVLNERLQQRLNPPDGAKAELRRGGITFRLGDKVMQVKNNYDLPYTRADGEPGAGAFNGDIGIIEEINPGGGSVTVLCEDKHLYYTLDNLNELELAYAVTIHKSQGSEFEAVVLPVSEVPKKLRYRNLLYTGVTRAKKLCVLAGEEDILAEMVRNDRRNLRYSCFVDFLQDEDWI